MSYMDTLAKLESQVRQLEDARMQEARERDRLRSERNRLHAAIQRIDGINDSPACFNSEINEVCNSILRPHLVKSGVPGQ